MRTTASILALFTLMLMSFAATAQDTSADSPADNACFDGGSMAGKCDWPTDAERDWAWTCGWYIARVNAGEFGPSDVPSWCFYDAAAGDSLVGSCISFPGRADLRVTKPLNTPNNVQFHASNDGSCTGSPADYPYYIVNHTGPGTTQPDYDASCNAVVIGGLSIFTHTYNGQLWLFCLQLL